MSDREQILFQPNPAMRKPLILTPDGIPDGWCIYIDNGVPVLARAKPADQNTVTYRPRSEEQ